MPNNKMVFNDENHKLSSAFIKDLQKRTALDLSFQSEARWDNNQKTKYITSLITGKAPSKIIVANVNLCLEKHNSSSDDWKYFADWKKENKDDISIDGNNRTITIDEYLNGKVKIKNGDYPLSDGRVVAIDNSNNTWYSHPEEFREDILETTQITVSRYINCSRADLTDLFLNINDGFTLNQQEKRNAILVPYSKWVRELTKSTYKKLLSKVFPTDKQRYRRVIDEFIVSMSIYTTFGHTTTIQADSKNKAYKDNSSVYASRDRAKKLIEDFAKFVDINSDSKLTDSSTLFNMFMAFVYLKDNKYVFPRFESQYKFYDWFMKSENKRIGNTKSTMTTPSGETRTYASCNSTMSAPELTFRFNQIIKDLSNVIGKVNWIASTDSRRMFNETERYMLWERQGGKCTITGKLIPESEINDNSKWAADHIVPFSKGGKTIIDNGQLIDKTENLKKSNKIEVFA